MVIVHMSTICNLKVKYRAGKWVITAYNIDLGTDLKHAPRIPGQVNLAPSVYGKYNLKMVFPGFDWRTLILPP